MVYFEKRGAENTEKTLQLARDEALKRGIKYVVIASTTGSTGLQAAQLFQGTGLKLIIVGHSTGHREAGQQLMEPEKKAGIEKLGAEVFIGTDVLTGFPMVMRARNRFTAESLIADALRMFGQGTKVAVEIVAMASDADLLPVEDVIAVAGTGKGADTCLVIGANSTNQFFDIKVREVLAKPKD